jgi:DNA-binding MarR family transcriptional regulator
VLPGASAGSVSTGLPKDIQAYVARLKHLVVDAVRAGSLLSPLRSLRQRGLSASHLEALWWIRTEGLLTVNALAKRISVSIPKATRVMDRLEELELGYRDRAEDDRRYVRLHLTEKGRDLAERVDQAVQQKLAEFLTPLEPEDRAQFVRILERMVTAIGRANDAGRSGGR